MFTFKDFGIKIEEATLKNGVPLLLLQKKGAPIHMEIKFASGSRFDPGGKEGLAHFVEHMITAGSKEFPSKDKLAVFIEQLGGIFGANTASDSITLRLEIAGKEDFAGAVLLAREMLTESLFQKKTVETERGAILKEIGDWASNPSKYVWELYSELFFQGTDVGRSNLGNTDSVSSISKEDLYSYYQDMLTSGRAVIAICGDIELDQVVAELEDGLPIPTSNKYIFEQALPVVRENSIKTHNYPKQEQVHLVVGFRTTSTKSLDEIPLNLLSTIFGGGRAAVLTKRLRYERGLVYGVGTSSQNFSNGGAWSVKTSTSKDKVQEVLDIICEEFARIAIGEVSNDELEFAKDKIIKSSRRQMQTSASWVHRHAYDLLVGNDMYFPEYLNAIAEAKVEDLVRVGKKYFKPGLWYLAVCGDVDESSIKVNF